MVSQEIHFFDGVVSHKRAGPKRHEFNYKYRSLYLTDVYDFEAQEVRLPKDSFWSYGSILSKKLSKILNIINDFCIKNNLDSNKLRLNLFKTPDIGSRQAFNPVCFWALMNQGECVLFIAEVTNTFKEQQCYEVSNGSEGLSPDQWYEVDKKMYVSPFTEKSGYYKFKICLTPFNIRISQFSPNHEAEIITALWGPLEKMEEGLNTVRLIKLLFNSLAVLFRIHFQAMVLWIKRFRVFPHGDNGYAD
tara:strand:- start:35 stop:775 length:741 start_codon:yes stop_codon:yes gene_type:complete